MSKRNDFLTHSTFVLGDNSLVVALPKAACTTVKHLLAHYYGIDPSVDSVRLGTETNKAMWVHHDQTFPDMYHGNPATENPYLRAIIPVRNPYQRLLSAWADKIVLQDTGYEGLGGETPRSERELLLSFFAFLDSELFKTLYADDPHFIPQSTLLQAHVEPLVSRDKWTLLSMSNPYWMLNLEQILFPNGEAPPVPSNPGMPLDPGVFYKSVEVQQKVADLYTDDLALGGWQPSYNVPSMSGTSVFRPGQFFTWAIQNLRDKNALLGSIDK